MAQVARTDIFAFALVLWLFGLLFGLGALIGSDRNMTAELIVDAVGAIALAWLLIAKVRLVKRMRYKMADWGIGIAQLTLIAYLVAIPIYALVCAFDRDTY